MTDGLLTTSTQSLRELAQALRAGRLKPPYTVLSLQRVLSPALADCVAPSFRHLDAMGVSIEGLATTLDLLANDRESRTAAGAQIDLVTSGPDCGATNRDTAVVVRDLFAYSQETVWIAGYAVHSGRTLFKSLAERMAVVPTLRVVLLLDIQRRPGDLASNSDLVRQFEQRFKERDWPEARPLPQVYFFPQSLEINTIERASLHAKCVVVDSKMCFVTSANFTDAAQNRNVEVGLLVRSPTIAGQLQRHLEALVENGFVQRLW